MSIYKTTNSGLNWFDASPGGSDNLVSQDFIDVNNGFVTTTLGKIYKTSNGGSNWQSQILINANTLYGVNFINQNTGYVVGNSLSSKGIIFKTTNAGINWIQEETYINETISSVYFPSVNMGWVVGSNGSILKSGGNPTKVNIISNSIPTQYKLFQNYPNPFNPTTKLRFALTRISIVKLVVYDVLGKQIETLINDQLNSGIYEVDWNASQYPSGVYYYKIDSEEYTETKRMVLLK